MSRSSELLGGRAGGECLPLDCVGRCGHTGGGVVCGGQGDDHCGEPVVLYQLIATPVRFVCLLCVCTDVYGPNFVLPCNEIEYKLFVPMD